VNGRRPVTAVTDVTNRLQERGTEMTSGLRTSTGLLCSIALTIAFTGAAMASFLPVDDFDSLELGPIDGQNDWRAYSENTAVVPDPAGGDNQVLQVVTESTRLYHEAEIRDGDLRMLFLRFRFDAQLNFSMGLSESEYPDQFGDFDAELNLSSATSELRINDGGSYTALREIKTGTWYNVWLLVDNDADLVAVWLHDRPGAPALPDDRLSAGAQSLFAFRDSIVGDLRTFYIKTGGGQGVLGPLYIDDIYLETTDTVNLNNPTDQATSVSAFPGVLRAPVVFPNPCNPRATVSFDLPQAQHVDVTVHDVAGRLVTLLLSDDLQAGEHTLIWKGRNRTGSDVASGVYFVRLRSATGTRTTKLLLAR
jgi:hypothetical protein